MIGRDHGWVAAAMTLVPVLAACGASGPDERPTTTTPEPSTPQPTVTTSVDDELFQEVEFAARDGELRSGRLFGDGDVAIVLSHMGRSGDSQQDWAPFARELADHGYQTLTYERRSTLGEVWLDVLGAVDYMRAGGTEKVIAGGASIGAMASLHAAEQPDTQIDAVIWLAGVLRNRGYHFQQADVSEIACPMLLISGDQDSYGAADDTRQLHDWATAPSELVILDSQRHGTDILAEGDPNANALTHAMLDFIEHIANETSGPC
jgi:dienelactone hydrolase/predicted small lipoprotein YifL